MSFEDMKSMSLTDLNDLTWLRKLSPEEYDYILNNEFEGGGSFQEHLKNEFYEALGAVAAPSTWIDQAKVVASLFLKFNQKIAICDAVFRGYQDKLYIWDEFVREDSAFFNNDQDLWKDILVNRRTFSIIFIALLNVFAVRVYGLVNLSHNATTYKNMSKAILERHFSIRDSIAKATGRLPVALIEEFESQFKEIRHNEFHLLDQLAEDIKELKSIDQNLANWQNYFAELKESKNEIEEALSRFR